MWESKRNREFWETLIVDIFKCGFFESNISHFCKTLKSWKKKRLWSAPTFWFIVRYLSYFYERTFVTIIPKTSYGHRDVFLQIAKTIQDEKNCSLIALKIKYLNLYAYWYNDIEYPDLDEETFFSHPKSKVFDDLWKIRTVYQDMKELWHAQTNVAKKRGRWVNEKEINEKVLSKWRDCLDGIDDAFYEQTNELEEKVLFLDLTRRLWKERVHWQTNSHWMKYESYKWNSKLNELVQMEEPYTKSLATVVKDWTSIDTLHVSINKVVEKYISDYNSHNLSHYNKALEYVWLKLVDEILHSKDKKKTKNKKVSLDDKKKINHFTDIVQDQLLKKYWDQILIDVLDKSVTITTEGDFSYIDRSLIKWILRETDIGFSNYLLYDLDKKIIDDVFCIESSMREVHYWSLDYIRPYKKNLPK